MTARLRQMEDIVSGKIGGFATGNFSWMPPPVYWDNPIQILRGSMQAVYDSYSILPYKLVTKLKIKPLNNVQMTKIDFITPKQPQHIHKRDFSVTIDLYGDNVGALAHELTGWYLSPPTKAVDLKFVTVDPKVASYLLQRAYSKMSSAEYDFGVSIGEVAETAAMLAKPLAGIARLSGKAFSGLSGVYHDGSRVAVRVARNATARQLRVIKSCTKQHPVKTSLRIVDESANHWLAYKFGVCPFIDDVDKAINFAKENVSPTFGLRTARVKGWKSDETVWRPSYSIALCGGQIWLDLNGTVRTIDRHYTGIYWRNQVNAPLINFLENIGFSPFQLPSLAYELVPLSFVVDRFIDIKSFVRGNIGSLSKQTYGNFTTRKVETIWSSSMTIRPSYGAVSSVDPYPQSSAVMLQMARSVNLDRPNFPVVNPYWQKQLIADATNLSLIWGRLRTFVGKH